MLLLNEIGQTPNISNKHMKNVLSLYIKDKFLTNSLLPNAKNKAKIDLFGRPHINAQYATALRDQMEAEGHNVLLVEQDAMHVHMMLERIVLKEEIDCQKREKVNMKENEKMAFLEKWREKNAKMLIDGGLALTADGQEQSKFFNGIFLSLKYTKEAVPQLQ